MAGLGYLGNVYNSLELRLDGVKDSLYNGLREHKQKIGLGILAGVLALFAACSSKPGPIQPELLPPKYETPTSTPAPKSTYTPTPTPTSLDVTVFELAEKLFSDRFSPEQQKEIWATQYKGKKVRWLSEIEKANSSEVVFSPTSETTGIHVIARFSNNAPSDLHEEDIYFFTGSLDSYTKKGTNLFYDEFVIVNSKIESPVLKKLWSRDAPTVKGTPLISGGYFGPSFVGVDSRYVYSLYSERSSYSYQPNPQSGSGTIFVLDRTNGYYVSETTAPSTTYVDKVLSMADNKFVRAQLPAQLPLQVKMDGFVLEITKSEYSKMEFYDAASRKRLGEKTFAYGIKSAVLDNNTLFLFAEGKLQAFQLHR